MKKHSTGVRAKRSSAESVKPTKRLAVSPTTRLSAGKDGAKLETKEERERRLAKRVALTIRAFRMAYDNHHQN